MDYLFIKCTRPVISMFFIYVAYLLLGSLIFVSLESFEEMKTINKSIKEINLAKDIVDTLKEANFSEEVIHSAFVHQKQIRKAALPQDIKWFYGDKMFFAFILISTIGYGNVTPASKLGQLICIVYTLFGLPLHVVMMRLLSFEFRGGLRKVLKVAQRFSATSQYALIISGTLFFLFWLAIFIFIPAYIFTISDVWSYNQGTYFSFVSLATIGLGDYVAGVSSEHFQDKLYPLTVVGMLIWMVFGLGFFSMAFNMLSYVLGTGILDKLDCKCQTRTSAKRRLKPLLELMKDLNWQLVKFKPDGFRHSDDIENFKELLSENPQDINDQMLLKIFRIVIELRGQAYDQLSGLMETEIPRTPVIQQARDNLPDILSKESTTVTFSDDLETGARSKEKRFSYKLESFDAHQLRSLQSLPVLNSETENDLEEDSEPPARVYSADDLILVRSDTEDKNSHTYTDKYDSTIESEASSSENNEENEEANT